MADKDTGLASRERVNEFAGVGCLLQALGLVAPVAMGTVWGVPGAVVGVLLLLLFWQLGTQRATAWRCSRCRNPLAGTAVRQCPSCGAALH